MQWRRGVHRLRRLHDQPRPLVRRLLGCGAGGGAGRQCERQRGQQERARVHGAAGARPAIDCDNWYTAVAYSREMLYVVIALKLL